MFRIRFAIYLLLAFSFLPGKLVAQRDAGQFVILSAQYGIDRNHVDVTKRLRDLARADRPIRVSNATFGIDPAPGVKKVLRIYARGPNGEQMFEYREDSVVDGAQFTGWRRGEWGGGGWSGNWNGGGPGPGPGPGFRDSGQFVILSAQYGIDRNHVDVTNRLRELARADQPIRVSNRTFGVDPAPGVKKVLRIYARGPNGEQMFEFREDSVVDGARFQGWRGGQWGGAGWSGRW